MITDLRLPDGHGTQAIRLLRSLHPQAEAMVISLIGGVIGIAIGVVGALVVGKLGDLPVELNTKVVMLAAAFSIGTGLFFGYYPARKASQLDPIEALRSQ